MTSAKFRVLNAEPSRFSCLASEKLREISIVDEIECDRNYLLDHIYDYDCIFICIRNVIDKQILDKAKQLKCIVTPTTGLNHIDVEYAKKCGVQVLSLKDESNFLRQITATAELTWALLLNLVRNIVSANRSVMNKEWMRNNFYGTELRGLTLGVVGLGRLGTMVANYGKVFGMKILAHDLEPTSEAEVKYVSFDQLLSQSDVISVHLSLNSSTRAFFNESAFNKMKNGAIFINTSRGEIIDESALVKALKSGRLGAAAIDVMSGEVSQSSKWLERSQLFRYAQENSNLLITPHIGGVTYQSVEKTNLYMIEKLSEFIKARLE